jgi:predicted small lipoprotein YifL
MFSYLRILLMSLFFLLLSACGQKGPLYQPEQVPVHPSTEPLL